MGFHASDIRNVYRTRSEDSSEDSELRCDIVTTFLGLSGSTSPLPSYLAEEVLQDLPENTARRDFLDIFHHRALSLLYRLVSRYRIENEHSSDGNDMWMRYSLCLAGIGSEYHAQSEALHRSALLRILPLLVGSVFSKASIERCLYLCVAELVASPESVRIVEFQGTRETLEPGDQFCLGKSGNNLGESCLIGHSVFNPSGRFVVKIVPRNTAICKKFFSSKIGFKQVSAVVNLLCPPWMEWDLDILISDNSLFRMQLSSQGDSMGTLGRCWLQSRNQSLHQTIRVPGRATFHS